MKIRNPKYLKENLQKTADESISIADLIRKLGLQPTGGNWRHVNKYLRIHNINTSHFLGKGWNVGDQAGLLKKKIPLEEILIEKSHYTNSTSLKSRLIKAGLLIHMCTICGIDSWRDQPLTLELDHINGSPSDNRIENLRLLCPNCHSQTETYCKSQK